ncbi:hypothetical protein [Rubrimonas sp.]|uniref:hypothetical protein n=1 Tax=Rubrimonas sp. TaxID=2036015 RepID=UPI002FDC8B7A
MWTKLRAAAAPPRHLRTAVRPIALALLFPLGLGAVPGSLFLQVQRFELYHGAGSGPMVVIERNVWPFRPLPVEWSSMVEDIEPSGAVSPRRRVVCAGKGNTAIGLASHEYHHIPVADWTGDADCKLSEGRVYALSTIWRFTLLGVPKTVVARTDATRLEPVANQSERR